MQKTISRYLWLGLVFTIALGFTWQFFPISDAKQRLLQFPLKGSNFSGVNVPLTPFESQFFQQINILKRIYTVSNQTFFIYALDGTHNRHLVHDPFYCFRGAGWEVVHQTPFQIPGGTANLVKLSKNGQVKETLYWFSDGFSHYKFPLRYWWQTTLRRLTLGLSGEEPVLIVIQPIEGVSLDWKQLIDQFKPLAKL
jgi:hypothetical protein